MLQDAAAGVKPTHLAVVFDKSEHTFRNEMYSDYKAHRPEAPDDLKPQFPLIRQATAAFNVPGIEQAGYEADDLIATYARQAREAGADVPIVASDKDLMQLVGPLVTMFDTVKDKRIGDGGGGRALRRAAVESHRGAGAGRRLGRQRSRRSRHRRQDRRAAHPRIRRPRNLLAHAGDIKQPKRREPLTVHAEPARISKKLVTLDQNVPLEVPIEDLAVRERDPRS